jgi:hypothetical protein
VAGVLTGCRQERERERERKKERKKERERKKNREIERETERERERERERDRPETSLALGRGLFSSSAASLCTHSFKKVVPSHPVEPAS